MKINFFNRLINLGKVQRKATTLKPIEPVKKIEPLRPVERDTVTISAEGLFMSAKAELIKRIKHHIEECMDVLDKHQAIDNEQETIKYEVLRIKQALEDYLTSTENTKNIKKLREIENSFDMFFKTTITLTLSTYINEINNYYQQSVDDKIKKNLIK